MRISLRSAMLVATVCLLPLGPGCGTIHKDPDGGSASTSDAALPPIDSGANHPDAAMNPADAGPADAGPPDAGPCGGRGEICCVDEPACAKSFNECRDGTCQSCGATLESCCDPGASCAGLLVCVNGVCVL